MYSTTPILLKYTLFGMVMGGIATTFTIAYQQNLLTPLFAPDPQSNIPSTNLNTQHLIVKKSQNATLNNELSLLTPDNKLNYFCRIITQHQPIIDDFNCTIGRINKSTSNQDISVNLQKIFTKDFLLKTGAEFNSNQYHHLTLSNAAYAAFNHKDNPPNPKTIVYVGDLNKPNPTNTIYIMYKNTNTKPPTVIAKYTDHLPLTTEHFGNDSIHLTTNLFIGEIIDPPIYPQQITSLSELTCTLNDLSISIDKSNPTYNPTSKCSIYKFSPNPNQPSLTKSHLSNSITLINTETNLTKSSLVLLKTSQPYSFNALKNKHISIHSLTPNKGVKKPYTKLKFHDFLIGNYNPIDHTKTLLFPISPNKETFLVTKVLDDPSNTSISPNPSLLDDPKNYSCKFSPSNPLFSIYIDNIDPTCSLKPFNGLSDNKYKIKPLTPLFDDDYQSSSNIDFMSNYHFQLTVDLNKLYNFMELLKMNGHIHLINPLTNTKYGSLNIEHYISSEGIIGKVFYALVSAKESKTLPDVSLPLPKKGYLCSFKDSTILDQECSIFSPSDETKDTSDFRLLNFQSSLEPKDIKVDAYYLLRFKEAQKISSFKESGYIYHPDDIAHPSKQIELKLEKLLILDYNKINQSKEFYLIN